MKQKHRYSFGIATSLALAVACVLAATGAAGDASAQIVCNRTLTADVVAFDMPLMYNRFGAQNINGMMFALRRDTINLVSGVPLTEGGAATPGQVALRPDKRPRPLVLRMGAGDCLTYTVTNLLTPGANPFDPVEVRSGIDFNLDINDQVADRRVSLRFQGTQLVNSIDEDGSFVGQNASSLIAQGATSPPITIFAERENAYVGTSYGATTGGEGLGGNTAGGLWAVLNVNPKESAFYRSQLTREEMDLATTGTTEFGQPIINYEMTYPNAEPWISEGKAGLPIINMVSGNEIVHTDINAIVAHDATGDFEFDGTGHFPGSTYPLESVGKRNPTVPNRLEPFREFTVAFHDEVVTKQAFPLWYEDPVFSHTLHGVRDSFMINYGSGGIGTEILANRLRVGAPHDCANCSYEEFFLTAFTVGDPAMLVDVPANFGLEACTPALANCEANGPKANYALFPDDPSNVHHTYTGDFTKFRNVHAGPGEQHVFHLHNHQWLFNANDDNSNYLDAQGLGPGSGYTYEINFGGSGNRNKTVGDAIFHCHFYPHFAQGMWELWRHHDVFEQGTALAVSTPVHTSFTVDGLGLGNGQPALGARALPDGEIIAGTPIPALVPLPGKPMPPMPVAGVTVVANPNTVCINTGAGPRLVAKVGGACPAGTDEQSTGSLADVPRVVDGEFGLKNPGYPFWIAGIEHSVGKRPPTPPLDMITSGQAQALKDSGDPLWQHPGFANAASVQGFDGGLPRFSLDGYSAGAVGIMAVTRLDFSKETVEAKPYFFPEEGTDLEKAAMRYHAKRQHPTFLSDGATPASFVLNGAMPVPGAPYNEPCIDDQGDLLAAGVTGNFFDADGGFGVTGKSPFNATTPRVYKAANVQFDAVFNKLGYHFPQQRIIALWQDVVPTVLKQRPPEPMVLRLNTFDCTQYVHSNVVPHAYELDDYQVRTPTDIIGQHIHLPKWDLTTADGSANGWNYEDGTLSPEHAGEMIRAINDFNANPANTPVVTKVDGTAVVDSAGHSLTETGVLEPANHPFFGGNDIPADLRAHWVGARSTMQRWFADPVVNVQRVDRGLGIIFTHDHYGPSTHQQIGLYGTVLIEPAGSKWVHNETGTQLYTRTGTAPSADGGPTSWQAAILTGASSIPGYTQNVKAELIENYREFYLEYSDFQHAYQPGVYVGAGPDGHPLVHHEPVIGENPVATSPGLFLAANQIGDEDIGNPAGDPFPVDPDTFRDAIQPSVRLQAELVNGFPVDIWKFPPTCPGGVPRPCPEAISADDPGIYVVNYRNESVMARVFDPNRVDCPDGRPGCQAQAKDVNLDGVIDEFEAVRGDLAHALWSGDEGFPVQRAILALNSKEGEAPATYFDGVCFGGVFCPPITQLGALLEGDPFTPTMRAFDLDRVHVKMQAGGQEEEHTFQIHGVKWLQAGSGFGEAKNSGWRNAQAGGISEQFSLRMPVFADIQQRGNRADYAYTANASFDGWTSGTWGILRSYKNNQNNLFALPGNEPKPQLRVVNGGDFDGVCPLEPGNGRNRPIANLRPYDVTAVLAEDVLPAPTGDVGAGGVLVQDQFPGGTHEGRAPDGGTLVYNTRPDTVPGASPVGGGFGPLHDPTAILYVPTENVLFGPGNCTSLGCPTGLVPGTPVEPLVLRANAGDCIEVTLRNALLNQAVDANGAPVFDGTGTPVFLEQGDPTQLFTDTAGLVPAAPPIAFDRMPDLATGNAVTAMVRRDPGAGAVGMTSFNSNLTAPSPYAGLHGALVEYDVTRHDGTAVGQNAPGTNVVEPGRTSTLRWYAGDIGAKVVGETANRRDIQLTATPIEFGGFNLMAADKLEQPQKGMLGAGVIYPAGSAWTVDAGTNTSASVTPLAPASPFRDFTIVAQKGASIFYADSFPVENIEGEGAFGVAEDPQDMGHMAINYGTEPLWFRFGVNPTDGVGLLNLANAGDAYSNGLVGENPQTAVFMVTPNTPFRQHVLMPSAPGRGSTFDLHGHVWQRDPYICPDDAEFGLPGKCNMGNGLPGQPGDGSVGSQALGDNPVGFWLGGIDSWFAGEHYEVVIPMAGGANGVTGDYLFRDHMGLGNVQGLWGIVRVETAPVVESTVTTGGGGNGGGGGKKPKK